MKYLLPLVMLAAAAWATQSDPRSTFARADSLAREASRLPETVPWLSEAFAAEMAAAGGIDPHADEYADGDPHAGLYGDDDPHAGEYSDDPHAGVRKATPALGIPAQGVPRASAQNGYTIAELHERRGTLAQQTVRVRGVVVKLTEGILGETYLHLQDGSGSPERDNHDLTVTTTEEFAIGDTVEVQGQVQIDRDLGLAYQYAVMLTAATHAAPN
jgi:hypothetical protein